MRPSRRLAALIAAVALGATALAANASGTPSANAPRATAGDGVHYAVNKPLCARPADPTAIRCYAIERKDVKKGTRGAYAYVQPDSVYRGPSGGLTPKALARAYGYSSGTKRSSSTVAVVDWYDDPLALKDLNSFDRHYGIKTETAKSFRKVNQNGRTSPMPRADRGSSGEIALDIQVVRAVCHTCKILLVEAVAPTDHDLATAENTAARLGATEISNSFGALEHKMSASVLAAFDHPGVVVTASTGDDGWYGWDFGNYPGDHSDGVASFPATDPDVVAVGGTTLKTATNGTRSSETVWNGNGVDDATGRSKHEGLGATAGGCSKYYTAKPWQAHYPGYAAAGCKGKRLAADVAAVADPETGFDVLDRYGIGGWGTLGGTSLSAPLVAAMYALAGGAGGAAYPSSAIYANGNARPGTRYDVTSGGNGYCGGDATSVCGDAVRALPLLSNNYNPNRLGQGRSDCSFATSGDGQPIPARRSECNAVSGYDGPSGVGTPRSASLFRHSDPSASIGRPSSVRVRRSAAFTAHVKEPLAGTHVIKYSWSWGDGKSSSTTSSKTHHTFTKAGKRTVKLTVVDNRYQVVVRKVSVTVKK